MPSVYFWSVVAFFAILAVLIYRDRKKIEFHNYVLAMRKTKRGRHFIYRVADASPRFWKALSTVAVIAAFGLMAYGIYIILLSTQLIFAEIITVPALQLILPVPQAQPVSGFGFIGVPFWFWILIVPFVLFPHEFAHGIIARVNKVRIKSVGLIQLLIFSGAFVEPDENQIKKSDSVIIETVKDHDPEKYFVFYLVRPDSFPIYREARKILWDHGIEIGWEPLTSGKFVSFGTRGRKPKVE